MPKDIIKPGVSMHLNKVEVVRRTYVDTQSPNDLAEQATLQKTYVDENTKEFDAVAVVEEVYDFTNKEHRRDVLLKMIADASKASGCSYYHFVEEFMQEIKSALQTHKDA